MYVLGSLLRSLPMGVISSFEVKARTSTSIDTALWTLIETGGSRARARTSSIDEPSLIFMIFILKARSDKLSRIISGRG